MTSKHYNRDRIRREKLIKEIGLGEVIATVEVDRGHRDGAELHTITTTGIIIIRNKETQKLITKLIARPNQIRRYFPKETEIIKKTIAIAMVHQKMGYNMI